MAQARKRMSGNLNQAGWLWNLCFNNSPKLTWDYCLQNLTIVYTWVTSSPRVAQIYHWKWIQAKRVPGVGYRDAALSSSLSILLCSSFHCLSLLIRSSHDFTSPISHHALWFISCVSNIPFVTPTLTDSIHHCFLVHILRRNLLVPVLFV